MSEELKLVALTGDRHPPPAMGMMAWIATEGGRKCPLCGRYARSEELGSLGGSFQAGGIRGHLSVYGHLPGYGCNRPKA